MTRINTPREPTFSPEKLAELINEVTASRKLINELLAKQTQPAPKAAKAAKPAKAAEKLSVAGKSEKQIQNEIETVKRFKAQGYSDVRPHITIKTYNRWQAEGLRPMKGSKSLKINGLRLFHRSQCEAITSEEKAANQKQSDDAVKRHEQAQAQEKAQADKSKGRKVLSLPGFRKPKPVKDGDDISA